ATAAARAAHRVADARPRRAVLALGTGASTGAAARSRRAGVGGHPAIDAGRTRAPAGRGGGRDAVGAGAAAVGTARGVAAGAGAARAGVGRLRAAGGAAAAVDAAIRERRRVAGAA